MAWAKLDDQFHSNKKLQRAQRDANAVAGVYARSLSYSAANLTDGFVDGYWIKTIAPAKLIAQVTYVGLWRPVARAERVLITGRRDSGRRALPDVEVICPADGYYIDDYLHFNPSRDEVTAKRNKRASERADDAQLSAHLRSQNGDQSQPSPVEVLQSFQSIPSRARGPVDRLLEVLHDQDSETKRVLSSLALTLGSTESDFEQAREAASRRGVRKPTGRAIQELRRLAAERSAQLAGDAA